MTTQFYMLPLQIRKTGTKGNEHSRYKYILSCKKKFWYLVSFMWFFNNTEYFVKKKPFIYSFYAAIQEILLY